MAGAGGLSGPTNADETGAVVGGDCLFCGIVAGDVPATVVRRGERTLTFADVDPQAPVHYLVVPQAHHKDVTSLAAAEPETLAELVAEAQAAALDAGQTDYRLVFNTGRQVGQSVFHVHGHVLAGRRMGWPPG